MDVTDRAIQRMAAMMAAEQAPSQAEDAAQEALIAAWQALAAGKAPGLVRADMRRAAINVDRGRSMTGSRRPPGANGVDTHQRYGTPLVATTEDGEEYLVADDPADLLEGVEMAYHRGELADALSSLTPRDREYVAARFWRGMSDPEIAKELGVSRTALQSRWSRTIRPTLAERLAHLEGVA